MKKYYYAGSTRVAVRTGTGSGSTGLSLLLGDQLGSTSITTNSSGVRTGELLYKPWGDNRYTYGVTLSTSLRFTGQREDSNISLYWYGSRWYDDALGRFISPDSMIPDPTNPADYDRYSYVRNNPVKYIDPNGHLPCTNGTFNCNNPHNTDPKPKNPGQNNDNKNPPFDSSLGGNNKSRLSENTSKAAQTVASISSNIPGTPQDWNKAAMVFDGIAWLFSDFYASGVVTYAGIAGAGVPAVFLPEGVPEVPVVTGFVGIGIAELYVQPILTFGNVMATLGTASTIIADAKDATIPLESNTINSIALTGLGIFTREAYLSLTIQSLSLSNDFGWTSIPVPNY